MPICWAALGSHLGLNDKQTLYVTSLCAMGISVSPRCFLDLPGKAKPSGLSKNSHPFTRQCTDLFDLHIVLCLPVH